jgi:hypothetical protein
MRDIIKSFFEKLSGIRRDQEDLFSMLTEQGDQLKSSLARMNEEIKELRDGIRTLSIDIQSLKSSSSITSSVGQEGGSEENGKGLVLLSDHVSAKSENQVLPLIDYDSILFGIDIGTTATRISCHSKDSHDVLPIGAIDSGNAFQMPSAVAFLSDRVVVGEAALAY